MPTSQDSRQASQTLAPSPSTAWGRSAQPASAQTYYAAAIGAGGAAIIIGITAALLPESVFQRIVLLVAFCAGTFWSLFLFLAVSSTMSTWICRLWPERPAADVSAPKVEEPGTPRPASRPASRPRRRAA